MRESSTIPNGSPHVGRWPGIELMRGVAAFGVIVIHAGLVVHHQVTATAGEWQSLFTFVVPFFLVTSLFFALRGERVRALSWREWFSRGARRLVIPYFVWTVIYLVLRVAQFYAAHKTWGPDEVFQDPLKIFVTGGTSLALYFLPLLFIGWMLVHALRSFLLQASLEMLAATFFITAAANQMLQQSGNGYDIGTGRGFGVIFPAWNEIGPMRLFLVVLAHAIRALPLIFVAAFAVRRLPEPNRAQALPAFVIGAVLCLVSAIITLRIGNMFSDLTWGVGTFLLGWSASALLSSNRCIILIGAFSFGVYLVHQLVLEAMQAAVLRFAPEPMPVGMGGILAISAVAFGLSMLIVGLAAQTPLRAIFGLERRPG